MTAAVKHPWEQIRAEYQAGNGSQRELAERFCVPYPSLRDRARAERWTDGRDKVREKTAAKVQTAIVNRSTKKALNNLEVLESVIQALLDSLPNAEVDSLSKITTALVRTIEVRDRLLGKSTADEVEKVAKAGGLTDEAVQAIRSKILGVNSDAP